MLSREWPTNREIVRYVFQPNKIGLLRAGRDGGSNPTGGYPIGGYPIGDHPTGKGGRNPTRNPSKFKE